MIPATRNKLKSGRSRSRSGPIPPENLSAPACPPPDRRQRQHSNPPLTTSTRARTFSTHADSIASRPRGADSARRHRSTTDTRTAVQCSRLVFPVAGQPDSGTHRGPGARSVLLMVRCHCSSTARRSRPSMPVCSRFPSHVKRPRHDLTRPLVNVVERHAHAGIRERLEDLTAYPRREGRRRERHLDGAESFRARRPHRFHVCGLDAGGSGSAASEPARYLFDGFPRIPRLAVHEERHTPRPGRIRGRDGYPRPGFKSIVRSIVRGCSHHRTDQSIVLRSTYRRTML